MRLRPLFDRWKWLGLILVIGGLACTEATPKPGPAYSTGPRQAATPAYSFSIHPLYNPVKLFATFQPLILALEAKIPPLNLELVSSTDYTEFEDKLRQRQSDIVLPNPLQTLLALEHGYHVVAMSGSREDFKGIFLVRKDSSIRTPADLKGQTVSYPAATALAACIMPQYYLFQHGLDINKDITNAYVGSQDSSIENVYRKMTAAGATWPPPWRAYQAEHPDKAAELRVIWETEPLLNNALMIRDDFPPDLEKSILKFLFALPDTPEGQALLSNMGIDGFHPATRADYEAIRGYLANFQRQVRPIGLLP